LIGTARAKLWFPANPEAPNGSLRLFCIPHAGAGASIYRTWAEQMPRSILVSPVQLPGREDRFAEAPRTAIAEIADELTGAFAARLNGPYALFGHSMGALIAFEVARRMRRKGLPMPAGLVLAAHQAPHLPLARKPISHLPDAQFLNELRAMGGMPEEVFAYPELVDFVLPALRADFKACDEYVAAEEPPLDIPLAILGGWKDRYAPRHLLERWREQSLKPSTLQMFPGGHFFPNENRDLLLRALTIRLTEWQSAQA
jgi:surfactin synthase thioesterase subunit